LGDHLVSLAPYHGEAQLKRLGFEKDKSCLNKFGNTGNQTQDSWDWRCNPNCCAVPI